MSKWDKNLPRSYKHECLSCKGGPASSQEEERDNRVYWTVWIRQPGTLEPQKYKALVDTGAQCTLLPLNHKGTESVTISGVTGGSQELTVLEAEVSLTGNKWEKHPIVTGPDAPCILGIDYLKRGYFKDPKGCWGAFGIAAVETEDITQLSTLPGLSDDPSVCRLQFAFTWRGVQYTWNRLPQGWKHSPTICHGLIQTALEKGGAPEHLQSTDDIILWDNTAEEVFKKGKKMIKILLKAGFAVKRGKVKGPAREIQFLGIKWQDGHCQIPMDVINKITAMSPPPNKKETQAFLGVVGFWRMRIPGYSQIVRPLHEVTGKKNGFTWGPKQRQAFEQIKQEIVHAVALGPV
ncbi:hypothetical protein llap_18190 [Limosa lapponica baueri]|uniref:ribonuclease H n=1 Tax=Limosa lapponica baueri TaxID=1758121 RepID=A0A2I0TCI1_LIMLA|nr:hypothetical protein llap_18190 [Limosa lapponica baueri]